MHCSHPSCTCRVQPGKAFGRLPDKPYCSESCATAESDAGSARTCACGHPGCRPPANPAEREVTA